MTGTQPYDEDDSVLAAEYALGLLTADAALAFEARLVSEPGLRAKYAAWADDLAGLTDDIAPVAPPAALERRIEALLFGADTARRPFAGWRGLGWLVGGAVAAALALLLVVDAGLLTPDAPSAPLYTADIAAEDGSLRIAASYDAEAGALLVQREAGAAPEGRALELWLIAGTAAPVSLGVLPDNGTARFDIAEALRPQLPGAVLAISDEPPGGSPTGAPTGSVLATGAITSI